MINIIPNRWIGAEGWGAASIQLGGSIPSEFLRAPGLSPKHIWVFHQNSSEPRPFPRAHLGCAEGAWMQGTNLSPGAVSFLFLIHPQPTLGRFEFPLLGLPTSIPCCHQQSFVQSVQRREQRRALGRAGLFLSPGSSRGSRAADLLSLMQPQLFIINKQSFKPWFNFNNWIL